MNQQYGNCFNESKIETKSTLKKKKKTQNRKQKTKNLEKKKLGETFFVKSGDGKGKLILAL